MDERSEEGDHAPRPEANQWTAVLPNLSRGHASASAYISIGILASQFAHIQVYAALSADRVQTWFGNLGFATIAFPLRLVVVLCLAMGGALFLWFHSYTLRAIDEDRLVNARRGALIAAVACVASQAIFSSIMRLAYEALFGVLAVAAVVLAPSRHAKASGGDQLKAHIDPWDAFKFAVTVALTVPVLSTGAALISSFWDPSELAARRFQLYRHVAMVLYFELGLVTFLILPLGQKLLRDREPPDGRES